MKTKQFLWSLLALMMIAIAGVGISACGDDDDDSGSGIEGSWTGTLDKRTLTLTFKSNYTGTWVTKYESSYYGTQIENGTFTYTLNGSNKGTAVVKFTDSSYGSYSGSFTQTFTFTIEGNKMKLYEADGDYVTTLTKGSGGGISGDDDDNSGSSTSKAVGTWYTGSGDNYMSLTFKSNGTGSWILRTSGDDGTETEYGSLVYTMTSSSKGTVSLKLADYDYVFISWDFVIEGSKMYLYQDGQSYGMLYKE